MRKQLVLLVGIFTLAGACKKDDPASVQPTILTLQVVYHLSGLPVDSATVGVHGTMGSYLTGGQAIQIFQQGYTDKQGRFQASMLIPQGWYTTLTTYKLVKIGNHYPLYSISSILPANTDVLNLGKENNLTVELDTLK